MALTKEEKLTIKIAKTLTFLWFFIPSLIVFIFTSLDLKDKILSSFLFMVISISFGVVAWIFLEETRKRR